MLFIDNKYTNTYNKIIKRAQQENRKKSKESYYELHHIVPRCMGGADDKDNLVLLTAREHYIAHQLLVKMVDDATIQQKLIAATVLMASCPVKHGVNNRSNNRLYEWVRKKHSKAMSEREITEEFRNKQKAKRLTAEQKEHLREINTGKEYSKESKAKMSKAKKGIKRKPITDETRRKMSEAHKGKPKPALKGVPRSEETKRKISEANKGGTGCLGYRHTDESRKKISEANKGRKQTPEQVEANRQRSLGKKRVYRDDGSYYMN
jgi:hypothetical protein